MIHVSMTALDVTLMETRQLVNAATSAAHLSEPRISRKRSIWRAARTAIFSALADSRKPYLTKDVEMASYGVSRDDREVDMALAAELLAQSRRRRQRSTSAPAAVLTNQRPRPAHRRSVVSLSVQHPCISAN